MRNARPGALQLLGSTRTELSEDAVEATLDLRIAPRDAKPFLDRLQTSAAGAGGRLLSTTMTGEDLTRQLIDAEAALRAKRTLRDRLQTLLEQRQGNLADLLAVERELAQTQQALDTATALLAELRQRVVFSRLSVAYRSERPLTGLDGDRPLAAAMARAGQTFSTSLAALLTLAVAALPWALPVGAAVWLVRRARRKRAV